MDDLETQRRFKAELKAPFPFVADPDGALVKLYDVKMAVVSYAQRYTFVIGPDRRILKVQSGSDAINPEGAIQACPVRRRPKPDAGTPAFLTPDAGAPKP